MADFNFVTSRLATGAAINDSSDVEALLAAGVSHVIDCRDDFDDAPLFASTPVVYLWNGTADDGTPKPPEWFHTSVTFALQALTQDHAKVYAHCAAGVNRGPSTCFAIMLACSFTADQAEQIIRAARPQVGLLYKNDAITAFDTYYK